jgi:hypothetical protein
MGECDHRELPTLCSNRSLITNEALWWSFAKAGNLARCEGLESDLWRRWRRGGGEQSPTQDLVVGFSYSVWANIRG